jgi:hypothetical protein
MTVSLGKPLVMIRLTKKTSESSNMLSLKGMISIVATVRSELSIKDSPAEEKLICSTALRNKTHHEMNT